LPQTEREALTRHWSSRSETASSDGSPVSTGVSGLTVKGVCSDARTRVLLCLNHREEWELPGGRPSVGETYPDCLTREIQEETGLHVAVRSLITAYPYEVLPGRWVHVLFYGCDLRNPASVRRSSEHRAVDFFGASELEKLSIADGYRRAISSWLAAPACYLADDAGLEPATSALSRRDSPDNGGQLELW
jgi:8-oxo-dGTP pyrophosphatase MutT (NUDIX family)